VQLSSDSSLCCTGGSELSVLRARDDAVPPCSREFTTESGCGGGCVQGQLQARGVGAIGGFIRSRSMFRLYGRPYKIELQAATLQDPTIKALTSTLAWLHLESSQGRLCEAQILRRAAR